MTTDEIPAPFRDAHTAIEQLAPDQLAVLTDTSGAVKVMPRAHELVELGLWSRDETGTVWLTQLGRDVMKILRANG